MRLLVMLLMLALVLAGCTGGGAEDGPDDGDPGDADDGDADADRSAGGNATGSGDDAAADWVPPATLHFTDGGLTADGNGTAQGRVALDWSGYTDFFVTNAMPPRFQSPAAEASYRVTSAAATVHITTDGLATASGIIGEVPGWLGTSQGITGSYFGSGPATLAAGDVAEVELEWDLPMGGLVVPAGESLVVDLATTYVNDPVASQVFLLTGDPEAPSHLRLEATPVDIVAPDRVETVFSESGTLEGAECLGQETETSRTAFEVEVPEAVQVRVDLTRTGGTPAGDDLDVRVTDASGTYVGSTHSPSGTETLVLYSPNLADAAFGTWTIEVSACAAQQAEFDVEVTAGFAPQATEAVEELAEPE